MNRPPHSPETFYRRPRWVVVSVVVAAVSLALLIVLMLAGGHSPGRHGG